MTETRQVQPVIVELQAMEISALLARVDGGHHGENGYLPDCPTCRGVLKLEDALRMALSAPRETQRAQAMARILFSIPADVTPSASQTDEGQRILALNEAPK